MRRVAQPTARVRHGRGPAAATRGRAAVEDGVRVDGVRGGVGQSVADARGADEVGGHLQTAQQQHLRLLVVVAVEKNAGLVVQRHRVVVQQHLRRLRQNRVEERVSLVQQPLHELRALPAPLIELQPHRRVQIHVPPPRAAAIFLRHRGGLVRHRRVCQFGSAEWDVSMVRVDRRRAPGGAGRRRVVRRGAPLARLRDERRQVRAVVLVHLQCLLTQRKGHVVAHRVQGLFHQLAPSQKLEARVEEGHLDRGRDAVRTDDESGAAALLHLHQQRLVRLIFAFFRVGIVAVGIAVATAAGALSPLLLLPPELGVVHAVRVGAADADHRRPHVPRRVEGVAMAVPGHRQLAAHDGAHVHLPLTTDLLPPQPPRLPVPPAHARREAALRALQLAARLPTRVAALQQQQAEVVARHGGFRADLAEVQRDNVATEAAVQHGVVPALLGRALRVWHQHVLHQQSQEHVKELRALHRPQLMQRRRRHGRRRGDRPAADRLARVAAEEGIATVAADGRLIAPDVDEPAAATVQARGGHRHGGGLWRAEHMIVVVHRAAVVRIH
ncbi:hypothetical protein STCU_11551 [Strigomonas culicis]|uniref:Uncharacterized protein n=1 Tax=Strigomonas culicis TaxID=28005 RepID=S9TDN3_9TRYP|nr:hypothetical protein STCU_11551 [Strigomonas culicis]|eukprot:EPY16102.1 hypothetical protein STCU_11551 [Strigomonas culicis]